MTWDPKSQTPGWHPGAWPLLGAQRLPGGASVPLPRVAQGLRSDPGVGGVEVRREEVKGERAREGRCWESAGGWVAAHSLGG